MTHLSHRETPPLGPGRLVAVVGPSGAGKDTLLGLARRHFAGDESILFPRRLVTREASAAEDHDTMSEQDFAAAAVSGAFAASWQAHGLRYALPASIDAAVRAGKTVVFNVSRVVVEELRRRYAEVCVVLVTAPVDALALRLLTRDRNSDGAIAARVGRTAAATKDLEPDVTIDNVGAPESGARCLIAAIATWPKPAERKADTD
jgi:ribose 1,5-bisphosphokinase